MRFIPQSLQQQFFYAGGIATTKLAAFLMLPLFTHHLVPADYARLDILQTLANLVSLVVGFGLADTLFRFAGQHEGAAEQRHCGAANFGLALVAFGVSAVLLQLLAVPINTMLPGGIDPFQTRLILGSLAFTACILVPLAWLRLKDQAGWFFLATAGWTVLQSLCTAFCLYQGWGLDGVLWAGLICSGGLAVVLSLYQWRSSGIAFDLQGLKDQGRFGGMLVLAGIATFTIEGAGRLILADHISIDSMAQFALAWKVGIMAVLLCEPFIMWWYPKRFAVLAGDQGLERSARITELGALLAFASTIAVAGGGSLVITLFSPPAYHQAIQYLPALAGLFAIKALTNLVTTGVLVEKKTLWPFYIDSLSAAIAVVSCLLLVPNQGIWGAIAAFAAAFLLRLVLYLHLGQRQAPMPLRYGALSLCALPVGVCLALCTINDDALVNLATGFASGILMLALAYLSGLFPKGTAWKGQAAPVESA